jgi:hypothetical protein
VALSSMPAFQSPTHPNMTSHWWSESRLLCVTGFLDAYDIAVSFLFMDSKAIPSRRRLARPATEMLLFRGPWPGLIGTYEAYETPFTGCFHVVCPERGRVSLALVAALIRRRL